MKEYKIEIKVKNNLLLQRILDAGFDSVSEFCKTYKLSKGLIGDFINIKHSAISTFTNEWKPTILKLCNIFKCSPEDLFTEQQAKCDSNTRKDYYVSEAEAKFYLENATENLLLENQVDKEELISEILPGVLDTLTSQEKKVIEIRFYDDKTLKFTANEIGLSVARVKAIEDKALRKLRHPSRMDIIEEYYQK